MIADKGDDRARWIGANDGMRGDSGNMRELPNEYNSPTKSYSTLTVAINQCNTVFAKALILT